MKYLYILVICLVNTLALASEPVKQPKLTKDVVSICAKFPDLCSGNGPGCEDDQESQIQPNTKEDAKKLALPEGIEIDPE